MAQHPSHLFVDIVFHFYRNFELLPIEVFAYYHGIFIGISNVVEEHINIMNVFY
jgi:hypothetical protein